ncbi:hypothetical protein HPB50_003515 [Hyalomma asiaticum]|uniref:Uncharacterized protein n=1 Tax=Hyalomma asiaticum TaxID=266040 RepID=A0ACB7RTZ5_HYAAI|nr:hypothetical protein HPB50_003515 [Hyalomma asiaticum]
MSAVQNLLKCAPECCLAKAVKRDYVATGNKQSPINIMGKDVVPDPYLSDNPLQWKDNGLWGASITNTGNYWQVSVKAGGPNICGGPLEHEYQMECFHGHWGKTSKAGSEHAVDGKYYAGEIHMVHFNADKFHSFVEAAPNDKGLVAVGVLLQEGAPHPQLQRIADCVPHIKYKGMKYALQEPLDASSLVPIGSPYWTYEGSLTTAPWYENVTWIVYQQPIEVSREQLETFRKLMSCDERSDPHKSDDGAIDCNVRATQPLKRRFVREPLRKHQDSGPIS